MFETEEKPNPKLGCQLSPASVPTRAPESVLLGSATVVYDLGPENGDGVNIAIPLHRLDGYVIRPGATFDFWTAVGTVSRRTGYRLGGIISGDHIEKQGALAGGICTVSTVLFDAAARAGLEILDRTSHHGSPSTRPLPRHAIRASAADAAPPLT